MFRLLARSAARGLWGGGPGRLEPPMKEKIHKKTTRRNALRVPPRGAEVDLLRPPAAAGSKPSRATSDHAPPQAKPFVSPESWSRLPSSFPARLTRPCPCQSRKDAWGCGTGSQGWHGEGDRGPEERVMLSATRVCV